ncbi:CvpA family protein [Natronospora cellulosivora (SeqCode)]
MNITIIDILILLMFLYFIISGYHKGFIRQTSTILGILLALLISMNYYKDFIPLIESFISVAPEFYQFISFAILFIGINIFVHILGTIFKRVLDVLFLKPIDHAAGAVLGLVKGFLVSYLLVLMLSHIPYATLTENIRQSILAARILDMTPFIQSSLQSIFKS